MDKQKLAEATKQHELASTGFRCNATEYREHCFSRDKSHDTMTLEFLKAYGSITAIEAKKAFGCKHKASLAARISRLRGKGYYITAHRNVVNPSQTIFILRTKEEQEHDLLNPRITMTGNERLYGIWNGIKTRCRDKNDKRYGRYGGRGITLCEEWNDFDAFAKWAISNGYDRNANRGECTIDRIDNNGNYEPSNCRWVNAKAQANNRRNNVVVKFNGETRTVAEWSRLLGIPYGLAWQRIKYGWDAERAFTEPSRQKWKKENK